MGLRCDGRGVVSCIRGRWECCDGWFRRDSVESLEFWGMRGLYWEELELLGAIFGEGRKSLSITSGD